MSGNVTVASLAEKLRNRPTHEWMISNLDKIEVVEKYFRELEGDFAKLQKQIREIRDSMNACDDRDRKYFQCAINFANDLLGDAEAE